MVIQGARVEGAWKSTSAFEEETVRTRTRFSVFERWYQSLIDAKALGTFDGWGPDVLADVEPGDTLEFRGHPGDDTAADAPALVPLVRRQGKDMFSQKGEDLKQTKEAERIIKMMLGDASEDEDRVVVLATPNGVRDPLSRCLSRPNG